MQITLKAVRFLLSPIIFLTMMFGAMIVRVIWRGILPGKREASGSAGIIERFDIGPKADKPPFATVGVPTYNRPEYLEKNLMALWDQTVPPAYFEVIVVNDGGDDAAANVVKKLRDSAKSRMVYIKQENRGPASARNRVIKEASGKIIAYLDDDCIADRRWLETMTAPFADEKIGGRGGLVKPTALDSTASRYLAFIELFEKQWRDESGEIVYPITCNAAFTREALESVGGFDENFPFPGGEDEDIGLMMRKKGYRFEEKNDAVVYHHHKRSLDEIIRVWYRYGYGAWLIVLKHDMNKSLFRFTIWKATDTAKVIAKCATAVLRGNLGFGDALMFSAYDFLKESAYLLGVIFAKRDCGGD